MGGRRVWGIDQNGHVVDDAVEGDERLFFFYVMPADDAGHRGIRQFFVVADVNNSQRAHFDSPIASSGVAKAGAWGRAVSFCARQVIDMICANSGYAGPRGVSHCFERQKRKLLRGKHRGAALGMLGSRQQ